VISSEIQMPEDGPTITTSCEETYEFARRITEVLETGDVIGLTGPLGAGKTVFVKGIAGGLGMDTPWQDITSPTYTLQDIYHLDETLFHCDAYRLDGEHQFLELGWSEQFPEGITAIEWVDRFRPTIDSYVSLIVRIQIDGDDTRSIRLTPETADMAKRLQSLHTQ
jgi:tRNA threonylcarbamoyladenosine biosynthesis protein TsaE